ncbi:hypothetical protein PX52LOC_07334 [Limnoglobus roseus]|uniref:Uncharacterized protein n=1 Tax=Limnoglobus roseus TaxID=2598579 RepID=A0A5C1AR75_9BACT|nr:hypothetical protein PX52LOC_07334 [Limnoglobus roseus]
MLKCTVGLLILAVLSSGAFLAHGVTTGVLVPYPEATSEQTAYENYHLGISVPLFVASAVAWMLTGIVAITCAGRWLIQGGRAKLAATWKRSWHSH